MDWNVLLVIDNFIREKFKLREEFYISEEGKEIRSLKIIRRSDTIPRTIMTGNMFNCNFKIDEINKIKNHLATMSITSKDISIN